MSQHITRLTKWAETRGFKLLTSEGTQREPENVVVVSDGNTVLLKRTSLDSMDTAAMYVLQSLERLGVTGIEDQVLVLAGLELLRKEAQETDNHRLVKKIDRTLVRLRTTNR